MSAKYIVIPSGCIECNAIVLWDDETLEAVLIDPTDDARPPLDFIAQHDLRARCVLLTHGHFDHAADAERAATVLGVPLRLHPADLNLYRRYAEQARRFGVLAKPPTRDPEPLGAGDSIPVSQTWTLQTLHVPGHSPGGVAFFLPGEQWLFGGDTLFRGSVGRTDLPGGNLSDLRDSIRGQLYQLPEDCLVVPGHGPLTTIGREKQHNGVIRAV